MKKITSACHPPLQANFIKKLLFILIALLGTFSSFATSYTSSANGGWGTATNWTPNGIPGAGDDVTINSSIDVTNYTASCLSLTINSGKSFSVANNSNLTINGPMTNNGTFTSNTNGSTNVINITLNGLTAAWINNGTFNSSNTNNTVIINGPGSNIGGSNSSAFSNLTINPGTANIVSMSNNISILGGGTLKLQSGFFKVGTNTINTVQSVTIDNTGGGNFANSTDGLGDTDADGGTINVTAVNGEDLILLSPATAPNPAATSILRINNIITGGSGSVGNWKLLVVNTGSVRINGMLKINGSQSNQWKMDNSPGSPYSGIPSKSFYWGPNSTLYIDHNNMTYTAGNEWTASSGTIGTTLGYPNNVTMTNFGTNAGGYNNYNGWFPGTGALAINGTLTIGDGVTNGQIDFSNLTSFSAQSVVINAGSRFTAPQGTMTLTGDFTDNSGGQVISGGSSGNMGFFVHTTSTVVFSGGGTSNITSPGKTDKFDKVIVTNGTYVKLNSPVDIDATGSLTLTSGHVGTTATNILNVTNTSNTAVSGGSPTSYVDGPLKWSIPANPSSAGNANVYTYPVGDMSDNGGAYLPLIFTAPTTTGATSITAQGVNVNSGGSPDHTTLTSISNTEYWSLTSSLALGTGGLVDVARPTPISPYTGLGMSGTVAGTYSSIGGVPVSGTEIGGTTGGTVGSVGAGVTKFIVMGSPIPVPLSVVRTGGNTNLDATCNPIPNSGTLIVSGVGGTGPYLYSMTSATGPWQSSNTFSGLSVGTYPVWVKDNATPTPAVAMKNLQVLGPLQINGNNSDITFCNSQSVTLDATNGQNSNATYSWTSNPAIAMSPSSTSPSITATPTAATTFTVTSTVSFTGSNLLTNGGFEGGNPFGFVADYANPPSTGYGTTPGSGAYYYVSTAATNLCTNFANPPGGAEEGTKYFIADGGVVAGDIFHLNLTSAIGLTANTTYTFSYWYVRGSVSSPFTPIETRVGSTVLGSVTASNTNWAQASYSFTTDASGNATITLKNTSPTTSTNGNDFLIDNLQVQLLTTCTVTASINVSIDCTSLPVELVKFDAAKQGNGALVTWATASEANSAYYVIEKSTDGVNFSPVGRVNASGNSSAVQNYSFVDPSISSGITYYQLVEYDINGASQHSAIKAVSKDGASNVTVVPNPNNGTFVVAMNDNSKARITVLNALGQIVYSNESTESLRNVDISGLASGVYYLQVSTSEEATAQKIIKE